MTNQKREKYAAVFALVDDLSRATQLLVATRELLGKIESGPLTDALAEQVHYDGADCDGACLLGDIGDLLARMEAKNG